MDNEIMCNNFSAQNLYRKHLIIEKAEIAASLQYNLQYLKKMCVLVVIGRIEKRN